MSGLSSLKPPAELYLEADVRENFRRWKHKFKIYMEATGRKLNNDMPEETKAQFCYTQSTLKFSK